MPYGPTLYGIFLGAYFLQIWGVGLVRIIFILGLERPFLDLVSQALRPRGRGRPLFAQVRFLERACRKLRLNIRRQ